MSVPKYSASDIESAARLFLSGSYKSRADELLPQIQVVVGLYSHATVDLLGRVLPATARAGKLEEALDFLEARATPHKAATHQRRHDFARVPSMANRLKAIEDAFYQFSS